MEDPTPIYQDFASLVRIAIGSLDALYTDATRAVLAGHAEVADIAQWAREVREMAFRHAQTLGIVQRREGDDMGGQG